MEQYFLTVSGALSRDGWARLARLSRDRLDSSSHPFRSAHLLTLQVKYLNDRFRLSKIWGRVQVSICAKEDLVLHFIASFILSINDLHTISVGIREIEVGCACSRSLERQSIHIRPTWASFVGGGEGSMDSGELLKGGRLR